MEELLARLIALQPKAQRIFEGNMREEFGDVPDTAVWATLEYGYDGDPRWHCGFLYSSWTAIGPVTRWALRAVRRTPAEAVQAMLDDIRIAN
ncbi:MAG: hypothetical protein IPO81_09675 [Kouleothrix sp.]|nr:hypothetical protein [Kouleothrix sp.]